jgi:hypothetical protein
VQVLIGDRLIGQGPGHEARRVEIGGQHLAEYLALSHRSAQQRPKGRIHQLDATLGIAGGHPLGKGGQDPRR